MDPNRRRVTREEVTRDYPPISNRQTPPSIQPPPVEQESGYTFQYVMACISSLLSIITTLILVILVLRLLGFDIVQWFTDRYTSYQCDDDGGIEEERESEPEVDLCNYQLTELGGYHIGEPSKQDCQVADFNFLESIYQEPEFIDDFYKALQRSYTAQIKLYNSKLRSQCTAPVASNPMMPDTAAGRNNHLKNELLKTINLLKERQRTLSREMVVDGFHQAFYDKEFGFSSLVGREDVKDQIALQIITFCRNPTAWNKQHNNMLIVGRSGVGKTRLAETIGFVLHKVGMLVKDRIANIQPKDLTTAYVNSSGQMTTEWFSSSFGGLVFIDEAYELIPKTMLGQQYSHGSDAMTAMVKFLDTYKGMIMVAAAGYRDDMKRFMSANEGMDRRFPTQIELSDYTANQLTIILIRFVKLNNPGIKIGDGDANELYSMVSLLYKEDPTVFDKQAGDMENLASCITRAIYGTQGRQWKDANPRNNRSLLHNGMNIFLQSKGRRGLAHS